MTGREIYLGAVEPTRLNTCIFPLGGVPVSSASVCVSYLPLHTEINTPLRNEYLRRSSGQITAEGASAKHNGLERPGRELSIDVLFGI